MGKPMPKGRDPRPKGTQRGVVRRNNQKSPLNTGGGLFRRREPRGKKK